MTKLALSLLAAVIASAVSVQPSAADALLCKGPLDFGVVSDSLGSQDQNISTELAELFSSRSGCRIRTISMPVKRVLAELQAGTLHLSGRFFQTQERDRFLWFAHIQRSKILGWFRMDRLAEAEASQLIASDKLSLGITEGFSHSASVDQIVTERRRAHPNSIIEFPDRRALFHGLLVDRADVVLLPGPIVEELNATLNQAKLPLGSFDLAPGETGVDGGIVFSKKLFDAETVAHWQRLVTELCQNGSILRVFQKYFRATQEDLACTLRVD